ncbi:hypothetical protein C4587_01135 [Candidatus Parcubacteria bacterium]|nr:MAG: hypothetical protein C4587_01135 [Candidatus Parcubacteria bacterium]
MPNHLRKLGSEAAAPADRITWDAPFGHCPLCESVGVDTTENPEAERIRFSCPDTTCTMLLSGEGETLDAVHTEWIAAKPAWLAAHEKRGVFWNEGGETLLAMRIVAVLIANQLASPAGGESSRGFAVAALSLQETAHPDLFSTALLHALDELGEVPDQLKHIARARSLCYRLGGRV